MTKVLVTYGSTKEIAEFMAETIEKCTEEMSVKMVGPARIELAISHTPSADHTKLDHGPSATHKICDYSLKIPMARSY